MQWKHSTFLAPTEAKVVPTEAKMMAYVFWDAKSIALIDYLQKGKTINGDYCANLQRQLRKAIKSERPGKLTKDVLFHQDNAFPYKFVAAMSTVDMN